jgi:hypothetical protein
MFISLPCTVCAYFWVLWCCNLRMGWEYSALGVQYWLPGISVSIGATDGNGIDDEGSAIGVRVEDKESLYTLWMPSYAR